jgi:hypothetical protein
MWAKRDRAAVPCCDGGAVPPETKEDSMRSRITICRALGIVTLAAGLADTSALASNTAQETVARKVTVRIAFTNNGDDVSNGGLAGTGHFTATGAIKDKGTAAVYRAMDGRLITLRFVTVGRKGKITFVVTIDTAVGRSRWTIASGTKGYKGLHGKGKERENASYTVSTLTGTVWR